MSLSSFLTWLMSASVSASLLALIWLLARRVAGRRLPPFYLVGIGWLVVGRFLLPAPLTHPWGLHEIWRPGPVAPASFGAGASVRLSDVSHDLPASNAASHNASLSTPTVKEPGTTQEERRFSWEGAIFSLWLAGVILRWCYLAGRHHVLVRRVMRHSTPGSPLPWPGLPDECRQRLGLRRTPRIRLCEEIDVPFLIGIHHPLICLPSGSLSTLSAQEARHVLLHEMLHIKRYDLCANWLLEAIKALHWFNPLLHAVCRRLLADRETLRDQQVLACLDGSESRKAYARTLLKFAFAVRPRAAAPGLTPFPPPDHHELQRRLDMITTIPPRRHASALLLTAIIVLVATATMATSETTPAPPQPPPREGAAADKGKAPRLELVFPEDIAEAPSVFQAVRKQEQAVSRAVHKAELLKAYDAAEAPMKHRDQVEAVSGAYAGKALKGHSPGGIMLWGPYEELPVGRHLIVYRFKVLEPGTPETTLFLDVCHQACTRSGLRLKTADLKTDQWQEIAIPVDLPEPKTLEFRFWPDGATVAIDRIYVYQLTAPDGAVDFAAAADEELPPGRAVSERSGVIRSPHTEDSGLIDISGLASGAKVRCPYTGKYFRVP